MIGRILRFAGIVVFVAAFFLPAVKNAGSDAGSGPVIGWVCALMAGAATAGIFHPDAAWHSKDAVSSFCLILSGWVNPLIVIYLLFCLWRKFVLTRRILAAMVLVCFVATWIFIAKAPMVPLIGHFLWVAGALMILAGEVLSRPARSNS